jgi:HSP20 family protein
MANPNPRGELQSREKQSVGREGTRPGPVFQPDVDIVEQPDAFLVVADLPGVDDSHVDVRLEDGVLSIEARPAFEIDPAWTPLHEEYRVGGYRRQFHLSDGIDANRIQARMREGVLELQLPKAERHKPRQIAVQTS